MRKIVINGRFLLRRITGVERYAREILSELDQVCEHNEYILAIPPEVKDIPAYRNIQIMKVGKLQNRVWEHISLPLFAIKKKAITLNLCNVGPLVSPGIVCIHDVKTKACPQFFNKKFLMWYELLFGNATRRCKRIITVSQFSKKEICKYYEVDPNKIEVIPNSWQHYNRVGYDDAALNKYGLEEKEYFFSMCSLEPNKNFRWIAEVAKKHPEYTFVVAGSINKTVFAEGLGFECPYNMKLIGYVADDEAKTLMKKSKAFLFPTFYEGFGIPPLEAISAGLRRIIVSDDEIMHELFEDKANYIDPKKSYIDFNDIKEMSEEDAEKILNKYSWKKSAIKLLSLLRQV
jgi:glycosyltransferase involved in cell wall biosynthesis